MSLQVAKLLVFSPSRLPSAQHTYIKNLYIYIVIDIEIDIDIDIDIDKEA